MGYCWTFFPVTACATWDLYVWNLPDCKWFDNNGEIHLFSSSAPSVIKDLESFPLVSHIVSDGKSLRGKGKATLDEFSLSLFPLSLPQALSLFFLNAHLSSVYPARESTLSAQKSEEACSPLQQLYSPPGLQRSWISFWIRYSTAFLIMAYWLCSFHCFRTPAFVQGGFYITAFAITSPKEDFLNYTQKCLPYEMWTRFCERVVTLLSVT